MSIFHFSLALAVLLAGSSARAAPLTLEQALRQAVQSYPALAAQQARMDAARYALIPAAELPDPRLAFGIDNFPVSGPTAGSLTADFMTMQRIGISQEVPNADKRRARHDAAKARLAQAASEQQVVLREVRRDTALAWIAQLAVEKKLAQFTRLEQENRLLIQTAHARIASGKARIDEALLPQLEALKLADQRDELVAQQQQASASLRRWLGQTAEVAADAAWPNWQAGREALQARLHQHPELRTFEPRQRVLAAELREAEAAKHSDWGMEVAYQRRGQQFGDMLSLGFSMDLPLFAERRQNPRIAAKQAEQSGLGAEREDLLRRHSEELERDFAEHERLQRALNRQRDALLPLLTHKSDLLLAGYRAGKTELVEVIAARAEKAAAELQLIELEGQKSAAAARLHFAYGEDAE